MSRRGAHRIEGGINREPAPQRERDGGRADFIRPVPVIDYRKVTEEKLLASQFLRLNTLYKVVDENGKLRPFTMRPEQYDFFKNMHNLNIILKSRQIGFTTVIQLFLLDQALFNDNTSCGVIAHTKDDAEKFFDKKIKLAYDNMPQDFARKYVPDADRSNANELKFENGSFISVGTSMRSDTLQFLHISEFGKLCAKFPDKAAEVVSGALNTVSIGNWITIESTGEGSHGHFYDMVQTSKQLAATDTQLSPMDYKFFFYPWWMSSKYRLNTHREPDDDDRRYFQELDEHSGIELGRTQKNWYVIKRAEQKERMWREYPSTPDEAFRGIIDGAPMSRIMSQLRRRGHITRVPWARNVAVDTFWDLGRNDMMAIWFMQKIGFECRFIDYLEDNLRPLSDYATLCNEKPYIYGTHHLPHDAEVVELTQTDSKSRKEILEGLIPGHFIVVPRIATEEEAVNMTRENMDNCWFDATKCARGIQCLENVKYHFDDKKQAFQPNLLRTWAKHGFDAFAQFGHGYRHGVRNPVNPKTVNELARANRGTGRKGGKVRLNALHQKDWRT